MQNRTLHRPTPIDHHTATPVDKRTSAMTAAQRLRDGESLLVTDHYGTGVAILDRLAAVMRAPPETASYAERQAYKKAFRAASLRLLAPIDNHWLALKDAGAMEFLAELYPESSSFFLPFANVQELHGAFVKYREGIHLAVLGHKLHPFYGTYVPTRTSHLELFGTWLAQYDGDKTQAIDVGTGSGVLAMMMAKRGFARIRVTDRNPNAIESVRREVVRRRQAGQELPFEIVPGDLLGEAPPSTNVIVFNPPWIQGANHDLLDQALFFETDEVFKRFFSTALHALAPDGRVVLVFSTIMSLVQPDLPHPIETELAKGRFTLVQKLQRKVKPPRDASGRRPRTREKVEIWELART